MNRNARLAIALSATIAGTIAFGGLAIGVVASESFGQWRDSIYSTVAHIGDAPATAPSVATLTLYVAESADSVTAYPVAIMPDIVCDDAMKRILAIPFPTVGYDSEGRAIPSVDAWCIVD